MKPSQAAGGFQKVSRLRWAPFVWFFVLLIMSPRAAYANVGLPMVALMYPGMLFALVPIIALEATIFEKHLHLGYRQVRRNVAMANVASTVVGFPLSWLLLFAVELVTWFVFPGHETLNRIVPDFDAAPWWIKILFLMSQAAWIGPSGKRDVWIIPATAIIGLVPAFFMSVGVEGFILKRLFKGNRVQIASLTWKANAVSYCFLAGLIAIWLGFVLVIK